MRNIPGWMVGAVGTGALVGAFYMGGHVAAAQVTPLTAAADLSAVTPEPTAAVEVECEPGQRATVRATTTGGGAQSVACVSDASPVAATATRQLAASRSAEARAVPVRYVPETARARPAAIDEPLEVYRPRAVPVSYESREVSRPTRSAKKSAVIIASSTAAGAVIGGLATGKKGALIGGIVSGGAATVWDQVTRRRNDGER